MSVVEMHTKLSAIQCSGSQYIWAEVSGCDSPAGWESLRLAPTAPILVSIKPPDDRPRLGSKVTTLGGVSCVGVAIFTSNRFARSWDFFA